MAVSLPYRPLDASERRFVSLVRCAPATCLAPGNSESNAKRMPYEVLVQVFLIQEIRYRPVLKRKFLVWHVLLPYQNDNELMTLILRCGKMYLSRTSSSHQT